VDAASRLKHFLANFCCCICTAFACCCACCKARSGRSGEARRTRSERSPELPQVQPVQTRQWKWKCPELDCCSLTEAVAKLVSARQYVRDSLEFAEYGKIQCCKNFSRRSKSKQGALAFALKDLYSMVRYQRVKRVFEPTGKIQAYVGRYINLAPKNIAYLLF
jgi:hypothetical protein